MIAILGGTGPEGQGLALRFAQAGYRVIIGSRDEDRAKQAAKDIGGLIDSDLVTGSTNKEAAELGSTVFISLPYLAQRETLLELRPSLEGKTVVDVIAPLVFDKGIARAVEVEEGSAAEQAQEILPLAHVVGAFHSISARDLIIPNKPIDCDVVVCSDNDLAKTEVMNLAETIKGVRAINGGGLQSSRYVEGLTALLLNVNRIYKCHSMIKIMGI